MAYSNFIPQVWAEGIDRELARACVFAEDCNTQYEGLVTGKGESVKILGVGKPTIRTIAKSARSNDIAGPEEVADTSVVMYINQVAYFNYMVGDIDKAQAVGGLMDALSAETSEGLANTVDEYIANLAKDTQIVNYAATSLTTANVLNAIDGAVQKLYENDVPLTQDIVITVTPRFYTLFRNAYAAKDTNNSDLLKHGKVAMYGNITVKMSNNVAKSSDGATDYIMIRTKKAIAYAKPLTHTEAYRPENKFADAVKGFILFDAKVVRPKEVITMACTYAG